MKGVLHHNSIYLISFFIVFCTSINGQGQWTSSVLVQHDSFQIGDPITLEVKINVPSELDIQSLDLTNYRNITNLLYDKDTVFLEKYADIEILDFGQWRINDIDLPITKDQIKVQNNNGKQEITNTIQVAIYNMGAFAIPGPNVITSPVSTGLPSESKVVKIYLPERLMQKDTVAFNPIKDIMKEEANIYDYLIYLYILLAILIMAGVGYYFFKRKKEEAKLPEIVTIRKIPAHEKALITLKRLDEQQLWQKGKVKEYQSGLTDAIREYLVDRYHIGAMEMTTEEISASLAKVNFDAKYIDMLKEILQVADLVKFAKAKPLDDIHSQFMAKAVDFVEVTKSPLDESENENV